MHIYRKEELLSSILFGLLTFVQILEEDGSLVEVGPRFCLNLIRIFKGSVGGPTLYENPRYVSPNEVS